MKNLLLIHIPKTAGTYLYSSYKNNNNFYMYNHSSCLSKKFINDNCTYKWG